MKILAIDYNSLMNRSFFAIRALSTKEGFPTNALLGFTKTYGKLLKTFSPDLVIAAYDVHAPTFRHKMFDGYKGTRSSTPEDLLAQMPLGKEFIALAGGTVLGIEGYEADDILGTIGAYAEQNGYQCIIATGDRDSFQLVSDQVSVNLASNKGDILYTPQTIQEQYGVSPRQLIEVKSLMGDSSDNIPGVKGIGEKTALTLIQKNGSLQNILEHLDEIDATPRVKKLIEEHRNEALLSHTLGEIKKDVPLGIDLPSLADKQPDKDGLAIFLTKYELTSVLKSFDLKEKREPDTTPPEISLPEFIYESSPHIESVQKQLEDFGKIYFLWNGGLSLMVSENKIVSFSDGEEAFARLVLNSPLPKITFDAKPVYRYAFQKGQTLQNLTADLILDAYLLSNSDKSYSLAELREQYLPGLSFPQGLEDIACLPFLHQKLQKQLAERQMDFLYREIELPLCEVLASMEYEGFMVDENGITEFGEMLDQQIEMLKTQIIELAGVPFNINSTQHLADVLFNRLGLPAKKKTKSGYSTNAEVLESLRKYHPIIDKILEYRKLSKLSSTYVVGLKKCIRQDGRVHSTFHQTETRTGRISSSDPNVQNIPIRTELGAEMRKFFVAKKGFTIVDADYSQIELRILAHISDDKQMLDGFAKGADIHRSTASEVFHVPFDQVPASLRSKAKAINFGIVYGISPFSLSQDIHVSMKEAKEYIDNYLATYSGVANYMKSTVEHAREKGYVETIFHRVRFLPDINGKNANLRSFSERVAMNMPIQGTAADIIKLAMIRVYRRLKEEGLQSRLILQVHDELLVETKEDELTQVEQIVKEEMENAAQLKVKLLVDIHHGDNWYLAKD